MKNFWLKGGNWNETSIADNDIEKQKHEERADNTSKANWKWPDAFYDQAWPGADYELSKKGLEYLQNVQKIAASKKRLEVDLGCIEQHTVYDWVFCLTQMEKRILQKSFPLEWEIKDFQLIDEWIRRSSGGDGSWRKSWAKKSPIYKPTDEDWAHTEALQRKGYATLSVEENQWLRQHYEGFLYSWCTHPDQIAAAMERALLDAKKTVFNLKTLDDKEKVRVFAKIALSFGTIHPFEDGTRRLVRLLIGVMLVQNGFEPFAFDSKTLNEALTKFGRGETSPNPFEVLCVSLFERL